MELNELYSRFIIPKSEQFMQIKDNKGLFKFLIQISKSIKFNINNIKNYNENIYYAYLNAKNTTKQILTVLSKKKDELKNLHGNERINFVLKYIKRELLKTISTNKKSVNTLNTDFTVYLAPIAIILIIYFWGDIAGASYEIGKAIINIISNLINTVIVAALTIIIYVIMSPNINYIVKLYKKNKNIKDTIKEYYENVIKMQSDDIYDIRVLKLSLYVVLSVTATLCIILIIAEKSASIAFLLSLIGSAIALYINSVNILRQKLV